MIAALTAVGVWQRNAEVSSIVSAEATAIASLWRDLGGYPQPHRDTMRDIVRSYTEMGCIVLCLFFYLANPRFQAILLLGLAGFIAMVLFVIIARSSTARPARNHL